VGSKSVAAPFLPNRVAAQKHLIPGRINNEQGDVMATSESGFAAGVLASWNQVIGQVDKGLAGWSDEALQTEVAPGRNRLYYLLGHLTAVHDRMLPLLRLGDRLYPGLDQQFLTKADRAFTGEGPTAAELRKAWAEVNGKLTAALAQLSAAELLERHASVSEEDFAKEPHRNRLAVVLSRTTHAAMHEGQMRLVKTAK